MEDEKIVSLYWERNETAIEKTQEKYGSYCMTIANRILYDHQESEECVNDTWLRAWHTMPPDKPVRLKLFLAKITRNLSFDRYRKRTALKRGNGEMELLLSELAESLPSSQNLEEEIITAEMIECLNRCLGKMPPKQRNIFLKRYFYAQPIAEIAEAFGISYSSVSMILSRTRKKLYGQLEREGFLA